MAKILETYLFSNSRNLWTLNANVVEKMTSSPIVNPDSPDWYERKIEEPVRDLVRFLRNNGINTECSCGHDMYIQCQVFLDGELQELHRLLYNYFNERKEKVNFDIDLRHTVKDGCPFTSLDIKLTGYNHPLSHLKEMKKYHEDMRKYHIEQLEWIDASIKREERGQL